MNKLWTALIVIIIVIILVMVAGRNTMEEYMYGFWVAENDEFCETSEINSMLLFIGEHENHWFSKTRPGYIIIMDDICNQGFTINYRSSYFTFGPHGTYTVAATVQFDEDELWPADVIMEFNISVGTLCIRDSDTIYAKLSKQHDTTNLAKAAADIEIL